MSLKQDYCDFEAKLGYILSGQPELDREIPGRVERNPNLSQLILRLKIMYYLDFSKIRTV